MEFKDIPTIANFATVQNEGGRDVRRKYEKSVFYGTKIAHGTVGDVICEM